MTEESALPITAVMLMAYGGPTSLDEVERFMCELTGREPSQEVLDRVKMRYLTIGGSSPLPEMVSGIAEELEKVLETKGRAMPVTVGFRYCPPRIGDTLRAMYEAGIRHVITVSMSPFESKITTEAYRAEVEAVLAGLPGMTVVEAPLLSTLPSYISLHAMALAVANEHIEPQSLTRSVYVMTAHSLPLDDAGEIDAYVAGLRGVADRVARTVMLPPGQEFSDAPDFAGIASYGAPSGERPWLIAYQSKGERGGDWLGPDLDDVIESAAKAGYTAVIVVPIGFAIDHMETMFDLDVVAAGKAFDLDMDWARADVPNADPRLIADMADMILRIAGS